MVAFAAKMKPLINDDGARHHRSQRVSLTQAMLRIEDMIVAEDAEAVPRADRVDRSRSLSVAVFQLSGGTSGVSQDHPALQQRVSLRHADGD